LRLMSAEGGATSKSGPSSLFGTTCGDLMLTIQRTPPGVVFEGRYNRSIELMVDTSQSFCIFRNFN
jgi:hypothetical protein